MLKEFRDFAMRGNAIDMAIGIIIGSAFGTIVNSLVNDIIMPPIGLLLGDVDFTDLYITLHAGESAGPFNTLADAQAAGVVTLNYGVFINAIMSFFIIAIAMYLLIRAVNRLQPQEEPEKVPPSEKECPYCTYSIPVQALRCPHCTSKLDS